MGVQLTPEPPIRTAMFDAQGNLSRPWATFFQVLFQLVKQANAERAEQGDSALSAFVAVPTEPQKDGQPAFVALPLPFDLVTGPVEATDNAVARFDGITGRRLKNSKVLIDENGSLIILNAASLWLCSQTPTLGGGILRFNSLGGVNYLESGLAVVGGSAAPLVFSAMFGGPEWARFSALGNLLIGSDIDDEAHALQVMGGVFADDLKLVGAATPGDVWTATDADGNGAWAASGAANSSLYAAASGDLTLGAAADVPGATVTLDRDGTWKITAVFDFATTLADTATQFQGGMNYNGVTQPAIALMQAGLTAGRATVAQQWPVIVAGQPKIAKLVAAKAGGIGTGTCKATNTTILAEFIG